MTITSKYFNLNSLVNPKENRFFKVIIMCLIHPFSKSSQNQDFNKNRIFTLK